MARRSTKQRRAAQRRSTEYVASEARVERDRLNELNAPHKVKLRREMIARSEGTRKHVRGTTAAIRWRS